MDADRARWDSAVARAAVHFPAGSSADRLPGSQKRDEKVTAPSFGAAQSYSSTLRVCRATEDRRGRPRGGAARPVWVRVAEGLSPVLRCPLPFSVACCPAPLRVRRTPAARPPDPS